MALSSLAHERYFQHARKKQLPPLTPYFKRLDGETRWQHMTPLLYPTKGLLDLREVPVSAEAFKYWLTAFVQRLSGQVTERDLRFMEERSAYYPCDDDGLVNFALPLSIGDPALLAKQISRFRRIYEQEGLHGLRQLTYALKESLTGPAEQVASTRAAAHLGMLFRGADGTADAAGQPLDQTPQWVNAYVALEMTDALRRRYRFVHGQRVDIVEDCARLAAFVSYFEAKPEMQVNPVGDFFMRMGHDVRSMATGARALDWSWLRSVRAYAQLPIAQAFGVKQATVDLVLNDSLVEIKPVRNVMVPGSADQLLASYLLYSFHYPEHEIADLRWYLGRHATWVSASITEIRAAFPVRAFAELLWNTTESFLMRAQKVDFENFCYHRRHVAGTDAWRMEDQLHSLQRRYERGGRIGATRIAPQRQVPHVVTSVVADPENAGFSPAVQRQAEARAIEQIWAQQYEEWQTALHHQYASLCAWKDEWRAFVERL
ncbi:MAG: hypothetical protein OWT28_08000 [Firmicutes bacterium]|nr:hypothetical protein [Bacillota bacterium]